MTRLMEEDARHDREHPPCAVGDRIRCSDDFLNDNGEIVTVTNLVWDEPNWFIHYRRDGFPSSDSGGWFPHRFERVGENSSMNTRTPVRPAVGQRFRLTGNLQRDSLDHDVPLGVYECTRHGSRSNRFYFRHNGIEWYVEDADWELVNEAAISTTTTTAAPLNLEEYVRKADVAKLVTRLQREKPDTDLWCDSGVWDRYVTPILGITKDMAQGKRTVTIELDVDPRDFCMDARVALDRLVNAGYPIHDLRIISDTREDA